MQPYCFLAAGWDVDDDDLELPPDLDPAAGGGAAAKGEDGEDEGSVIHVTQVFSYYITL